MKFSSKLFSVLLVSFVVAALLRVFVVEGFFVAGDSMSPTIMHGEYIFVNKLAYVGSEPEREDIVVAKARNSGQKLIKRIIGLPGERFAIERGSVVIRLERGEDGKILNEDYLTVPSIPIATTSVINIDEREYFALGDNREVSIDSREVGPIDVWSIKGRVFGAFNFKTLRFRRF